MPKKADVEKLAAELWEVGRQAANEVRVEDDKLPVQEWDTTYEHQRVGARAVAKYVLANLKRLTK